MDLCYDIIYQHTKFELNQYSLSKVIERTPNFDNGRTHGQRYQLMPLHHSSNGRGIYYISTLQIQIESMQSFKLLSGHQILITDGRTGITLNAPPPFFEWLGNKNIDDKTHDAKNIYYLKI